MTADRQWRCLAASAGIAIDLVRLSKRDRSG